MASNRLSFAIICAGALIWAFGLTVLSYSCAHSILPTRGRMVIQLFLSTFFCGIFAILIRLINPLLILGTFFFLVLVPPWCMSTGFFEAVESLDPFEAISRALLEAVVFSGIIIAISLIREPFGMGAISIPGSVQGIMEIYEGQNAKTFLPGRILSISAGGLLLFGYIIALYRYFKNRSGNISEE
jgi:Na+-transporting NADH:ubiquinone oxidoreductase subunit NqrD